MNIVIYTTTYCPYCIRAKRLLDSKNLDYKELNVESEAGLRQKMIERAGRTSVPQIFFDDRHIGGSDELYALERSGELDQMLGISQLKA